MQILASYGLLMIVMGISGGAWYLWEKAGDAIIPAGRYLVACGVVALACAASGTWLTGKGRLQRSALADPRAWVYGLLAIFLSDWLNRSWGLFNGPSIRGELLIAGIASYALFRSNWRRFFLALPFFAAAILIWSLSIAADGRLLFSDDHAMFLFRLQMLKENFPSIPFWSPLWNSGFDARDFFATGSLNLFLIAAPLIYAFPVESLYPYLIAFVLWVLTPLSVYCAARILRFSSVSSSIASTLSMCTGLFWYRWALKYGTVGFITSAALLPYVVALAITFVSAELPRWRTCALLGVVTTLMLFWSPSGVAVLPLALVALPKAPRLLTSKRHILTLALLIALNLPWMGMMWKVSKVSRFLNSSAAHSISQSVDATSSQQPTSPPAIDGQNKTFRYQGGGLSAKRALQEWHNFAASLNPIVLIFAVPALLSLPSHLFPAFGALFAWLALAGTLGVSLKPQLELDRMLVLNSLLLTIPIGSYMCGLFERANQSIRWRSVASCSAAFLVIGPCAAASVVLNRSDDTYAFANQDVDGISEAIRAQHDSGRVLFTGCVLHELSGGHLAPLPLWTNTPMYASSYAHNIWTYEQPFPKPVLQRGDEGITDFLDETNTTLVAAHEPTWIEYLRARPLQFTQVWRGETFFLFKRSQYKPTYSVEGELQDLTQSSHSITLTPLSGTVVLKFRYFPFLVASACSIKPYRARSGTELIKLDGCIPGKPITISSVSPLSRLFTPNL